MKEKMKQQLKELDQKQQDFVQRIGEARDLLAELMFTSDAFFTLQKRELLHHMTASCEHENRYTKEGIIFCNDCGNTLGFVEEDNGDDDLTEEHLKLIREHSSATNTPDEYFTENLFNYDLERMKEAIDSPTISLPANIETAAELTEWLNSASFDLADTTPPKKINYCPYLDGGFCYANKDVATNAINSICFNPQKCPANQG